MKSFSQSIKDIFKLCGFILLRDHSYIYNQDGLVSIHNHDFIDDPTFIKAYQRGVKASCGVDSLFHWRVHVVLWVAHSAGKLPGDFVECGVNKGFYSSAIMEFLDWNSLDKNFYLLDTFSGIDERFVNDEEKLLGRLEINKKVLEQGGYELDVESVRANFSEWERVRIIKGAVPETLGQVDAEQVAYVHLDMNCAIPELAAAEFFWPRLAPGAFMLFDDYAYFGFTPQTRVLNGFAESKGVKILSLPTGQGLVIKPMV